MQTAWQVRGVVCMSWSSDQLLAQTPCLYYCLTLDKMCWELLKKQVWVFSGRGAGTQGECLEPEHTLQNILVSAACASLTEE